VDKTSCIKDYGTKINLKDMDENYKKMNSQSMKDNFIKVKKRE